MHVYETDKLLCEIFEILYILFTEVKISMLQQKYEVLHVRTFIRSVETKVEAFTKRLEIQKYEGKKLDS